MSDENEQREGSGDQSAGEKAQAVAEEREQAKETMRKLEDEEPPEKLEDWPSGAAKYETFGGPEGEHSYNEGPEEKLGPSSLRHHEDGRVEVAGEEVDDPDEYKSDPIPGGPTDPDAPQDLTTQRIRGGDDDSDDDSKSDDDDKSDDE